MRASVQILLRARPSSRTDDLAWDPWRRCWQVRVRAPAVAGQANQAIREVMAHWLGLPLSEVRWVHAGTSASKTLEVDGLSEGEVERRLRAATRARPASAVERSGGRKGEIDRR